MKTPKIIWVFPIFASMLVLLYPAKIALSVKS